MSGVAIASVRLGPVAACERRGEGVAVDRPMLGKNPDDRDRHRGVVGPTPRAPRPQRALIEQVLDDVPLHEVGLAERVADTEAVKRQVGTGEAGVMVGRVRSHAMVLS